MDINIPEKVIFIVEEKEYCLRCSLKANGFINTRLVGYDDYAQCHGCRKSV